jgi:hypothetical protein
MLIVENGTAKCSIYIPKKPTQVELHSAAELKKYLKKISGANFSIIKNIPEEGPAIIIANVNNLPFKPSKDIKNESIMRFFDKKRFFLVGGTERATLIGIYAFLRDNLGCIFAQPYPSDEYIPKQTNIKISEVEYYHEPFLPIRYLIGGGDIHTLDWCAKVGMSFAGTPSFGVTSPSDKTPEYAGEKSLLTEEHAKRWYKESVLLRGEPGLSIGGHLCESIMPPSIYFDKHPEYFAYNPKQKPDALRKIKNGRDSFGICWTNPEVKRIFKEYIYNFLKKYPFVTRFTFFPNDGQPPCFCENCCKTEKPWQGTTFIQYTKNYVLFSAEIARTIAESFPGVRFEIGSYASHSELPKDFNEEIPENLDVLFCIFERKWDRALDDPPSDEELHRTLPLSPIGSYENDAWKYTKYSELFNHWRKYIKGDFRYYDYLTSTFGSMGMLFPVSKGAVRTIRYLKTLGFVGYGSQWFNSPLHWASYGLSLYVTSRAMWDKNASWDTLAAEYCKGFYENAAEPMIQYFRTLEDSAYNVRFGMGIPEILQVFDPETYKKCNQFLSMAKSCDISSKIKMRIRDQENLLEFGRLFWETRRIEKEIENTIQKEQIDNTFKLLIEHAKIDDKIQKLFNKPLLRFGKSWRGTLYRHLMGSKSDKRGLLRVIELMKNMTNSLNKNLWYKEDCE